MFWHHIPLGVEFRGGTLVYVKFAQTPDLDQIRKVLDRAGLHDPRIQRFGPTSDNEVLVDLGTAGDQRGGTRSGQEHHHPGPGASRSPAGKQDLNNTGAASLQQYLLQKDPLHLGDGCRRSYSAMAQQIDDFRNKQRGGILNSVDELRGVVPPEVR